MPATAIEPSLNRAMARTASVEVPPNWLVQSKPPLALIFEIKTSDAPAVPRVVVPNRTLAEKVPVRNAEPSDDVVIARPWSPSCPVPPACVVHAKLPSELRLVTKISAYPRLVSVVLPNVAVALVLSEKRPATTTEPSALAAMAFTNSSAEPPTCLTQSNDPLAFNLAIKTSEPPRLVSVVSPNVAESEKRPVTTTDPSTTARTDSPASEPVPPAREAHTKLPLASSRAMNASTPPALVSVVEPNVAVPENDPVTIDPPSSSTATERAKSAPLPPATVTQGVTVSMLIATVRLPAVLGLPAASVNTPA